MSDVKQTTVMLLHLRLVIEIHCHLIVDFQRLKIKACGKMGGGEIRLIVGFQPLMVISPTASWIRWCMQVYAR